MWKSQQFVPKKSSGRNPRFGAHPSVGIDVRMPHLGLKPVFFNAETAEKDGKAPV